MSYKILSACRVCGSKDLTEFLDLGEMPLSNNLCSVPDEEPDRYPLTVLFCGNCNLSQLSIVVDPVTLFGHYVYRSSIAQGYVDHCRQMAKDLKQRYGLTPDSFVIDLAGNDGALLAEFKDEIGCKVLNIDPAENLALINADKDIKMFNTFWGFAAAKHLINANFPKADVITATNVFAHVDNVKEFLEAAKLVLKPDGVLLLEFPYLIDFIEGGQFDTIYFEHLSYFSIWPLYELCANVGLAIADIQHLDIHGGSVRVTIKSGPDYTQVVNKWLRKETEGQYNSVYSYIAFQQQVKQTISNFRVKLAELAADGAKIGAFGASAKGNTLLNCAGITSEQVSYIIDQTPEKMGKYSPGTGIPIYPLNILQFDQPDYIILLAWNFKDECISKLRLAGYKGKFILPLTFEIIEQTERQKAAI